MNPAVIDLFRPLGITEPAEIKALVVEGKKDILSKGQVAAAEIAGRKDMLTTVHFNIPKILLQDFGVDVQREFMPDNLMLLCRPCNGIKSGHLDFSFPQTKTTLLKLLEKL